jgi:putative flippase GtrA
MHDEVRVVEVRPHMRLVHGMRRPENWLQLMRFGIVGGVGFVVNLLVYAALAEGLGLEYHVASAFAWLVAVANNFFMNRHWTFDATHSRPHGQAARFLVVSLVAFAFSQVALTIFVEDVGLGKVVAQAIAVLLSMPLNFIGNKLWSFRSPD